MEDSQVQLDTVEARNREVEEVGLNEIPPMNESLSGVPYLVRSNGDTDTRNSFLRKVRSSQFELTLDFDMFLSTYSGTYTYTHGLGYRPIVLAAGQLNDGDTKFEFPLSASDIDINQGASHDADDQTVVFTFSGDFVEKVKVIFHLLKPPK